MHSMLRVVGGCHAAALLLALAGCDSPSEPSAALTWKSLSAGSLHTCAIRSDDRAFCWGNNAFGQLGVSNFLTAGPVEVPGSRFTALAAGLFHTCGITTAGPTWCWGATTAAPPTGPAPRAMLNDPGFRAISAGSRHICGLTAAGAAYCWGDNFRGELGIGLGGGLGIDPTPVAGGVAFASIDAGDESTCASTAAGQVYCWGGGSTNGPEAVPEVVDGLILRDVVMGGTNSREHLCGELNGGVACWGYGHWGEVGNGEFTESSVPVAVTAPGGGVLHGATAGGGPPAVSLAGHSCALAADGTPYCWGSNAHGELGDGTTTDRAVPTPVAGGLKLAAISAGGLHTCGLTTAGEIYCWGGDTNGQIGDTGFGQGVRRLTPIRVPVP